MTPLSLLPPTEDVPHSSNETTSFPHSVNKDSAFRIQTIARIACITLAALSGATLTTFSIFAAAGISVAALTTAAIVSSVALGVVFAMKTLEWCAPRLPMPLRHLAYYIHSMVKAVFSILTLGLLLPVDAERLDPKTPQECHPRQVPILLIHGFCGSSNNWLYHRQRLVGAGYSNIFTINLGSPFRSIEDYAKLVRDKVASIQQVTGQSTILLVGHSMGGLVGRTYRYDYAQEQGIRIPKIITLGTPLNGTYAAYLAAPLSPASRQMEPGSAFVCRQQELASSDDSTQYCHIGSAVDSIVLPPASSFQGGSRQTRTVEFEDTGHIELLFSDAAADLLIEELGTI